MNTWRVILAAVVIFTAGALSGGFYVRSQVRPSPVVRKEAEPFVPLPHMVQKRFVERIKKDLELNPEQAGRVEKIFTESQERIRIMWSLVGPEMQTELREVRDKVSAELTPAQRERFEELLKKNPNRGKGGSRAEPAKR